MKTSTEKKRKSALRPSASPSSSSVLDSLIHTLACVYSGLSDSFAIFPALIAIYSSRTIRARFFKCILLNGIIFLGSINLFDYVVLPVIRIIMALAPSSQNIITMNAFVEWSLSTAYHICWIYPIYILSFLLNSVWYQELADRSYRLQVGEPAAPTFSYQRFLTNVASELFRFILFLVYLLLTSIIHLVPYIGPLISFVLLCWLSSFYSFEYKWVNKGWDLRKRLDYTEERWAYFLGFGMPSTLMTFFFPQFISAGIFALVFPLYILLSNRARPLPEDPAQIKQRFIPQKIGIFRLPMAISTLICFLLRNKKNQ